VLPLIAGRRKGYLPVLPLFNGILEFLANAIKQNKTKKTEPRGITMRQEKD
jgi:hypothetical protein